MVDSAEPDLTILVPTYRRPEALAHTLHRIESCRRDGLEVEVIVIDNAADDATRDVCEQVNAIDVRYIVEPEAGKNRALNRGLAEPGLGRIVVFTDDDVEPALSWLVEIRDACNAFPDYDILGGQVEVEWPDGAPPSWARGEGAREVRELGFTEHAPRHDSGPYPTGRVPFGPNFWIRRKVLENGIRFDEDIGPHPDDRILGDETQFLRKLVIRGHRVAFAARATVRHRVTRAMVDPAVVRQRAFDQGRGIPYERGLPMPDLLARSPASWRALRGLLILRDRLHVTLVRLIPGVTHSLGPLRTLGHNVESLKLATRRQAE